MLTGTLPAIIFPYAQIQAVLPENVPGGFLWFVCPFLSPLPLL